jgi:hypothetical protein
MSIKQTDEEDTFMSLFDPTPKSMFNRDFDDYIFMKPLTSLFKLWNYYRIISITIPLLAIYVPQECCIKINIVSTTSPLLN